jgi:tRNA U34 5-carboxymethylaminomethyl modifying enzyme MnmG/GidA
MLCTCRMARVEAYDEWSHALEHHYEKIKKALSHNVKARCFLWRLFTRKVIPGFALFTFENTINLNKQKFTQLEKSLRKLQAVDKQLKEGKSQQEPDAASLPVQVDWASVMPSDNPSCPNGWHML